MTTVYATPAAMAEQGAALRALLGGIRRGMLQLAATARAVARPRRPAVDHAEMARRRAVAHALEAMRAGAYADVALGGPAPR
ncbi:hypothetical protein JNB62_08985 [Microbacterium jejuense]|uniref:Uncharacterized protein n=1 Tax=Microbacterium jejuense TaxID=1263637 RepID=A0ABS7HM54_9MICO|nr:hypothetical protein [Microbacterium jejuense]MBW9093815.1 hypothetical protein [Microbacterium jejuense]